MNLRRMLPVAFSCVGLTTLMLAASQVNAQPSRDRSSRRQRQDERKPPEGKQSNSRLPHQSEDSRRSRRKVTVATVDPYARKSVLASAAKIDRLIAAQLRHRSIAPNGRTTDAQFVRRAYLDIVGTIPTGRQTFAFLSSKNSNKRSELIDDLLNQPGYASHLFNYFADLLRIVDKAGPNTYTRPFADWLKESLRENISYRKLVFEMLTAEGKSWENPAVGYKMRDRGMPLDNLDNTIRIFLGTRIGCAQCHDHPFDDWTQRHFYQLAAFEGGIKTTVPRKQFKLKVEEAERLVTGRTAQWVKRIERYNREQVFERASFKFRFPRDYAYDNAKPGEVVRPDVIFGDRPQLHGEVSRRAAFAEWLTSAENPRFAATIANRLWQRAFGIGIVEPVDDLRSNTAAAHSELWEFLVAELKRLDFNLKEFQRLIYHTETYQRQATLDDIDRGVPYHFQGPLLRRMTAEQVWDSLLTLTLENPDGLLRPEDDAFTAAVDAEPDATPQQLAEKAKRLIDVENERRRVEREQMYKSVVLRRASELPQPLPAGHFLRQFGQSDRQLISDGNTDGTVPQLMTLFNGPVTHMMLEEGSVIHSEVTKAGGLTNRIKIIFLSVLGRLPTASDMARASSEIRSNRNAGYGDVIWALLNTREFLFMQ